MRIDFHSHILPEMDDGAINAEMSKIMLEKEFKSGIKLCALTSHYYFDDESPSEFLERRKDAQKILDGVYSGETMPQLIQGAEVHMYRGMSEDDLSPLCLGATNMILCEMPMVFEEFISDELSELVCAGFVPIVAHFERYFPFYREKHIEEILNAKECVFQINAYSLESRRMRNKIFDLAKKGYDFVLGTDAHNLTTRPPVIDRSYLESKSAREFVSLVESVENSLFEILKQ